MTGQPAPNPGEFEWFRKGRDFGKGELQDALRRIAEIEVRLADAERRAAAGRLADAGVVSWSVGYRPVDRFTIQTKRCHA